MATPRSCPKELIVVLPLHTLDSHCFVSCFLFQLFSPFSFFEYPFLNLFTTQSLSYVDYVVNKSSKL
jgi:hypothetical protein